VPLDGLGLRDSRERLCSSVVSSSSLTGLSAVSLCIRSAASRVMTNLSRRRRAIVANNDGMFAERFPNEPRPEDEGALARQARTAPRRMLEPQYAALKRMYIFEFGRGRKVDEHLDEPTALRLPSRGVGASPYASGWNRVKLASIDRLNCCDRETARSIGARQRAYASHLLPRGRSQCPARGLGVLRNRLRRRRRRPGNSTE
jgi:hypothetical protein